MKYVIKKAGKFMEGHSYCNIAHIGYKFSWTKVESEARFFESAEQAKRLANVCSGKVVPATVEGA